MFIVNMYQLYVYVTILTYVSNITVNLYTLCLYAKASFIYN